LGIVTGLAFEAGIVRTAAIALRQAPPPLACHGPGAERARAAAESLIAQGVTHLMSFGIAAGLDPELTVGTAIVASGFRRVGAPDLAATAGWRASLAKMYPGARAGLIAHSDTIVATAAAKAALHADTSALVADMESYGVAQAAAAAGLPCAAIRVVSDRASHKLPSAALGATRPDGTVNGWRVLGAILRRPWQVPALVGLAEATRIAQKQLYLLSDLGLARGFVGGGH
jgi:hopanoid-associated phosphorylase